MVIDDEKLSIEDEESQDKPKETVEDKNIEETQVINKGQEDNED